MAIATTKEINATLSNVVKHEKAAQEIVCRLADGDIDIPLDAYRLFEALDWNDRDVEQKVAKMRSVRRHQRLAGTAAEREAARKLVDELNAENELEIPKIDKKIAALKEQRRERLAKQDAAEKVCNQHNQAVLSLRRQAPQWAVRQRDAEKRALNRSSDKKQYVDLKRELALSRAIAKLRPNEDIVQVRRHCELHQRHMLTGQTNQLVNKPLWDSYQAKHIAAIPGLEAEFAEVKAVVDAHVDSIDSLLDVWVSEAGQ